MDPSSIVGRAWTVALLLGCAAPAPSATLLQDVRLIDGSGQPPAEHTDLLFNNAKITAIGPHGSLQIPRGTTIVDGASMSVVPGLISDHSHLGQVDGTTAQSGNMTRVNILRQLTQYEAYGITTVTSLGLNMQVFYQLQPTIHQGSLPGADMFGADRGFGAVHGAPPGQMGISDQQVYRPTSPDVARAQVRETIRRRPSLLKLWLDDFHGSEPEKIPPDIYEAIIDEAHRHHYRVAAHVYYLDDAKNLLTAGIDVLAHGVRDKPVDADFIRLIKQREVWYIPTLDLDESFYIFAEQPEMLQQPVLAHGLQPALAAQLSDPAWRRQALSDAKKVAVDKQARAMNLQNLKTLYDAGVKIGFGTDSGATRCESQGSPSTANSSCWWKPDSPRSRRSHWPPKMPRRCCTWTIGVCSPPESSQISCSSAGIPLPISQTSIPSNGFGAAASRRRTSSTTSHPEPVRAAVIHALVRPQRLVHTVHFTEGGDRLNAAISSANVAHLLVVFLSVGMGSRISLAEAVPQKPPFIVHGTPKTCSDISQMDSAMSSGYGGFFAGWTERDYADAFSWAISCSVYGWHVPGRARLPLLQAQRDAALSRAPAQLAMGDPTSVPPPRATPAILTSNAAPATTALPRLKWSSTHELPSDGSAVIGFDATVMAHHNDTLPDIARRYGLGYEEIRQANPGVDIWLPGEGTRVRLPGRHRVPAGSHQGVVVDIAERRLYFFPKSSAGEKSTVITFPVSIGKAGQLSPLGQTVITAKVEHPSWYPPSSVRKEHARSGESLPAVVAPGPDNPLGDFMMRLGFGDGSYEIHGTNKPVSVGMDVTNGCIGMYPEDVATLFAMVDVGTPVRLIDERL